MDALNHTDKLLHLSLPVHDILEYGINLATKPLNQELKSIGPPQHLGTCFSSVISFLQYISTYFQWKMEQKLPVNLRI